MQFDSLHHLQKFTHLNECVIPTKVAYNIQGSDAILTKVAKLLITLVTESFSQKLELATSSVKDKQDALNKLYFGRISSSESQ